MRNIILESLLDFLSSSPTATTLSRPEIGGTEAVDEDMDDHADVAHAGEGISQWRAVEHARKRGRIYRSLEERALLASTRAEAGETTPKRKKRKGDNKIKPGQDEEMKDPSAPTDSPAHTTTVKPRAATFAQPKPPILDYLSIGINEITRSLEASIRWNRWELGDSFSLPGAQGQSKPRGSREIIKANGNRKTGRAKARGGAKKSSLPKSSVDAPSLAGQLAYAPEYDFISSAASSLSLASRPDFLIPPEHGKSYWRMMALPTPLSAPTPSTLINTAVSTASPLVELPSSSTPAATTKPKQVKLIDIIFVCKPDINPPSLVGHLPTMVAAYNSLVQARTTVVEQNSQLVDKPLGVETLIEAAVDVDMSGGQEQAGGGLQRERKQVLLIALDKGAELRLSNMLGLRRVAAIGISVSLTISLHSVLPSHRR